MSWLPRLSWSASLMSDGSDPSEDAQGWMVELEWRGHILELSYLRRGAVRIDN